MRNQRTRILRKLPQTVFGLSVFAFGVYMSIVANIGLAPWDALGMGISYHLPLSYGRAVIAISLLIVVVDLIMGERIGVATILNAILVGLFVDAYGVLGIIPAQTSALQGMAIMLAGLFVMSLGQYFYMKTGLGCGPRDTLLVGLGKRLSKVPIGAVNTIIMSVILIGGWLLGAPIGIGTVISTFGIGIAMQIVFKLLRFEPRDIVHESIIRTMRELLFPASVDQVER